MNDSTSDNAGVIAIPPIIYLVGLLLGLLLHYLYPVKFLPAASTCATSLKFGVGFS
ncbi:MAG: hypothetical protein O7B27_00315 [Gammaproteobacteria bacterium]|nr:hypothetical protein [Pseudomonadota bacterium]MCZ6730987.1 hypothetical protein [Gammaproteobacteria bacterium]